MTARVGLTCGCPAGIGPEVTAAAIAALDVNDGLDLVWFADASLLVAGAATAGVDCVQSGDRVEIAGRSVRCQGSEGWHGTPGEPDAHALHLQRTSIDDALVAAAEGRIDALYTAPIRKAALDGIDQRTWPGHTELLQARLGTGDEASMLFAGGPFLLALATVHVPLAHVASTLTTTLIQARLRHLTQVAQQLNSSLEGPLRIVVLGLNPHAGEGGRLGREEIEVIRPALSAWTCDGVEIEGPVPADGFFAELGRGRPPPDAVLAMSHDQGLAPYKLLAGGSSVNLTAGLRVLRTSPDHGTADGIAGRGVADSASAAAALKLASRAARERW